jgi:very-short-patch-repair endonuclease
MGAECKYCGEKFKKHSKYAAHIRWCKNNPDYEKLTNFDSMKIGVNKKLDERLGKIKEFKVPCFLCKKIFFIKEREKQFPKKEKYFCSRSCANTRKHSNETKKKISKSITPISRKYWKNKNYIKKQLKNNKNFFTSKGEEEIKKYFKYNFPKDRWTFGGNIRFNNFPLIRDLYSNKLKVCIEYDGIWHFEDIKGQLEYKQRQDLSLELWCIKNGYRLIRIKEERYYEDEEFWINRLVNEVKNGDASIVKFY